MRMSHQKQVNVGSSAVSSGTTRHLIVCNTPKRKVVEDNMTNVTYVNSLYQTQFVATTHVTSCLLNALNALGASHAPVPHDKHNLMTHLSETVWKHTVTDCSLLSRINIGNALLA